MSSLENATQSAIILASSHMCSINLNKIVFLAENDDVHSKRLFTGKCLWLDVCMRVCIHTSRGGNVSWIKWLKAIICITTSSKWTSVIVQTGLIIHHSPPPIHLFTISGCIVFCCAQFLSFKARLLFSLCPLPFLFDTHI